MFQSKGRGRNRSAFFVINISSPYPLASRATLEPGLGGSFKNYGFITGFTIHTFFRLLQKISRAHFKMAERVGSEPTSPFGRPLFDERRLKPLGNLSSFSFQFTVAENLL